MQTANFHKVQQAFVLSIFGASGELARQKIFPSLYEMALQKRFPKKYAIVGFARTSMSTAAFKKRIQESIFAYNKKADKTVIKELLNHVEYVIGDYANPEDFIAYKTMIRKKLRLAKAAHIAYFATPPNVFRDIVEQLAAMRNTQKDDIRLVIEKPFGTDAKSAQELFHFIGHYFSEDQVYLLDHYLGKSSVQSIVNMRRANRVLSHIIRGSEVANIQITAFEKEGVDKRIGYFEQVGITRDIMQSHLLQILSLVTMNIPQEDTAQSLQREKDNIIEAVFCPCNKKNVILGQYDSYSTLPDVPKKSKTDTFAAVRLFLDQQDWEQVPIYIRTGKKLHEKHTYVVIELKKFPFQQPKEEPNRVLIEFYPHPKITISLINYQEEVASYQSVTSSASIACSIDGCLPPHADLLLDVFLQDRTHFLSFEEVVHSWEIIDHITEHRKKGRVKVEPYPDGSSGPSSQELLPKQDGFHWFDLH